MASTMTMLRSCNVNSLQRLEIETSLSGDRKDCRRLARFHLQSEVACPRATAHRLNSPSSELLANNSTKTPFLSLLSSFGNAGGNAQRMGRGAGTRRHGRKAESFPLLEQVNTEVVERAKGAEKAIADIVWPYVQLARIDKPVGIWFFLFLSYWTISLASPVGSLPDLKLVGWFTLLGIINRSAGCTINDIVDMDVDMQVERSKTRPLASGAISRAQGIGFYAAQLAVLGGILLQLNSATALLLAAYVPMYSLYPAMKRLTFLPQGYLSLCIAWPLLAGWTAVRGALVLPAAFLPPFFTSAIWIFLADTLLAHADKRDDAKAGVKSTALLFGEKTKLWMAGMDVLCAGGLAFTGFNNGLGWPFYVGAAAALAHLTWVIVAVDLDNPRDCIAKFFATSWVFSPLVFAAITLGRLT